MVARERGNPDQKHDELQVFFFISNFNFCEYIFISTLLDCGLYSSIDFFIKRGHPSCWIDLCDNAQMIYDPWHGPRKARTLPGHVRVQRQFSLVDPNFDARTMFGPKKQVACLPLFSPIYKNLWIFRLPKHCRIFSVSNHKKNNEFQPLNLIIDFLCV